MGLRLVDALLTGSEWRYRKTWISHQTSSGEVRTEVRNEDRGETEYVRAFGR
jgi:hypothetical protein